MKRFHSTAVRTLALLLALCLLCGTFAGCHTDDPVGTTTTPTTPHSIFPYSGCTDGKELPPDGDAVIVIV